MKTITRFLFAVVALAAMTLTSCNSGSDEDIRTAQQLNSCYAAVTDLSTGTTTYCTGITFGLELNWSTAKANITIAGLKTTSVLPHIQLEPMDWSVVKDKQSWYQASSTIVGGASTLNTTHSFNNFRIEWIDRINLGPAIGYPYQYFPGCVFSFELDGRYRVVGSRAPFLLFGETVSTDPAGKEFESPKTYYQVTPDFEHMTLTIGVKNAQFSAGMPSMDMLFPNIPMTVDAAGIITFSAANLIPQLADKTPQPDFPISDLAGRIDPARGMEFAFKCNVRQRALYSVEAEINYTDFTGLTD